MAQGTRPDKKEIQRLTGIALGHARLALAKPETQRESYLATCRANWKRYAASFTKSEREREHFAVVLDGATREMMALLLESGEAVARYLPADAPLTTEDEAMIAYQAGYVLPALDLPMTPEGRISKREPAEAEASHAEPEDDGKVRYGKPVFSAGGAPPLGTIPKPAIEVDPELDKIRQKTRGIIGRKKLRGL